VAVLYNDITANCGDKDGDWKPERTENLLHEAAE